MRGEESHHNLTFDWTTTVENIAVAEWEECFNSQAALSSYRLAVALERSELPNVSFQYLVGRRGAEAICILPCHIITVSLESFAPPWVHKIISSIRRIYPNFLKLRVLIIGHVLSGAMGLAKCPQSEFPLLFTTIKEQLIKQAQSCGAQLIAFKEVTEELLPILDSALSPDFFSAPALPSCHLFLDPAVSYENRLRSRYRNMLRRRKKLFDKGELRWEVTGEYSQDAAALHNLYTQVLENAPAVFEVMTEAFFRELSAHLADKTSVVIARKGNDILAFGLLLSGDNNTLYALYFGFDYAHRDDFALYYNTYYRTIEEAERRGITHLHLGHSAYESKALLGAEVENQYFLLCALNWTTRIVLRSFKAVLFPTTSFPSYNVFKNDL